MIRFVLLIVSLVIFQSHTALAQESTPLTRGILNQEQALPDKNAPISDALAGQIFKECRSTYPRRFTPNSLDHYCDCAVASTQLAMTVGEYAELQQDRNRKATNETFQKYVTAVVAPCMSLPTIEIEYFSCVLDMSLNPRINNIPKYCQCVAGGVQKHVRDYGDIDIFMSMSAHPRINDPFEALWMSDKYKQSSRDVRKSCLLNYMDLPPLKPPAQPSKRRSRSE